MRRREFRVAMQDAFRGVTVPELVGDVVGILALAAFWIGLMFVGAALS